MESWWFSSSFINIILLEYEILREIFNKMYTYFPDRLPCKLVAATLSATLSGARISIRKVHKSINFKLLFLPTIYVPNFSPLPSTVYLCAGEGDTFHDTIPTSKRIFFFKGGRAVELTSRNGRKLLS